MPLRLPACRRPDLTLRFEPPGRLGQLKLLEGLKSFLAGKVKPPLKFRDRRMEIIPARHRCPCKSGISEMIDIANAGGLLLDLDLLIEVVRHPAEVRNHQFEVIDLLTLLFIFKALILNGITRLNHNLEKPPAPATRPFGLYLSMEPSFARNH
jgi:hypothetical protein